MTLILHRSAEPESLAAELAQLLASEPADVFARELVVVPARGVERWLTQRLSHVLGARSGDDGVCAGLEVMSPYSLTGLVLGRLRDDPWQPDRLVWPVLEAMDAHALDEGFEALARHIGAAPSPSDPEDPVEAARLRGARQTRRYAVARRLAGLFSTYARERPALLRDWEAGRATDGLGAELAADLRWQPVLWRATVERVQSATDGAPSPVERHDQTLERLRASADAVDLPARLSLFGHTRLAESEIDLLEALGVHRDVHLWLPHPSPALWESLAGRVGGGVRSQDDSATLALNPLLATLARDARELQLSLAGRVEDRTRVAEDTDIATSGTRLQRMQAAVRANRAPVALPEVDERDESFQVHACHGAVRQVEVLREVLVSLLHEGKGDLQPRDIIVMCPDVETFTPLIHAAFGHDLAGYGGEVGDGRHPGQGLRVQLADRALGASNPLVELAHRLLLLVASRFRASDVLDLVAMEPVSRRYRLDADGIAMLRRWVGDSGVRWGLDAAHRAEYGLDDLDANTWRSGLDRIALGAVMSGDSTEPGSTHLPLDDVGSNQIESVGAVLELMERLQRAAAFVRQDGSGRPADGEAVASPSDDVPPAHAWATARHTASEWATWLRDTVLGLTSTAPEDAWQVAQLERELDAVAESAGAELPLHLTDVRVMLEQRWGGRPSRSNFRTGAVTVCTMVPMRSVPHRVVIVLGVDDGIYPRTRVLDGDDALARDPRVGERDGRSEDSQLVLDALMSAKDAFIAIYAGFNERDGSPRPPAVPLQELISAAAQTGAQAPETTDIVPAFVRQHPLQAFDERNFAGDEATIRGGTFDRASLDGAKALRELQADPDKDNGVRPALITELLPALEPDDVTIDELVAFFENPAREFLRRRLEVSVPREAEETDDAIPLEPDALELWGVGDRVVRAVLDGGSLEEALDAERRRGSLPPGGLADSALGKIQSNVSTIVGERPSRTYESVDVSIVLPRLARWPRELKVRGTISRVDAQTRALDVVTYSSVGAKHVLGAWVRLLALAVAEPDRPHQAVIQGKPWRGGGCTVLDAPAPQEAALTLARLVDCRLSGLSFPIGLPPKTGEAYAGAFLDAQKHRPNDLAEAVAQGRRAATRTWSDLSYPKGKPPIPGENADQWWVRLLGARSTIEDLETIPDSARTRDDWQLCRTLTYWAPRIWSPILDARRNR